MPGVRGTVPVAQKHVAYGVTAAGVGLPGAGRPRELRWGREAGGGVARGGTVRGGASGVGWRPGKASWRWGQSPGRWGVWPGSAVTAGPRPSLAAAWGSRSPPGRPCTSDFRAPRACDQTGPGSVRLDPAGVRLPWPPSRACGPWRPRGRAGSGRRSPPAFAARVRGCLDGRSRSRVPPARGSGTASGQPAAGEGSRGPGTRRVVSSVLAAFDPVLPTYLFGEESLHTEFAGLP